MKIETKYNVMQRVKILAINQPAIVMSIKLDGVNILYELEYWWNGEIRVVWQCEFEIGEHVEKKIPLQ